MTYHYDLHEILNEPSVHSDLAAVYHDATMEVVGHTSPEETLRGRGETILLVDDEPLVREALQDLLENLHYRVLTAANGEEALAIYERHRDTIALVLTDLVMPVMGGSQLCRSLRQCNSTVKILVMTAYPRGLERQALQEERPLDWLQKPCSLWELAQAVRRAL